MMSQQHIESTDDGSARITLTRKEILETFRECLPSLREKLEDLEEQEEKRIVLMAQAKEKVRQYFKNPVNIKLWYDIVEIVYFPQDKTLKRIRQWVKYMEEDQLGLESIEKARSVSIIELARMYGQVKETNSRGITLCPFHDDKHPSLVLYKKDNGFHCFSCGADGDPIKYIMHQKDLGFRAAVKYLCTL